MDIEDNVKKLLVAGENVILADSTDLGRLVLTSRRLFICGPKGMLNRNYAVKREVSLRDIGDVYGEFGKATLGIMGYSYLVIKPKVGEEWRLEFSKGSMTFFAYNVAQTVSMSKVNNWVNAIKLALH